ncbi:hypothetical protein IW152_000638 [Coemansia sp. BCRC 34962]|nr:hypothetical protein IW152_000638 [Coemansia sp. BCRC 34962]
MMAYYQQRDLVYSALGVESLVTTTGHLVAGWELVLKPLARVAITGGAALPPLEETPECACLVISCDPGSLVAARRFQRDMLRRHPRIQGLQVEAKQVEAAIYDVNSRDLPLRATAMDHFMTEMEPRIRAILLISKPHVQFQVTSGVTGNCTELFLVVEALNQVGRQVRCSVAVLFTAPYHSDDGCNDTLTNEASPSWVVDSELPSGKYGRKILGRIREYFEGGSALAPPAVCGTIHKHIAIWSTYNDMWIVRREGTRNPTCTQPETLPRAEAESMLTISTRFAATNADPHIAFVYVEVLDDIIETMQESTEGYPLESQELLSTNPTTAM